MAPSSRTSRLFHCGGEAGLASSVQTSRSEDPRAIPMIKRFARCYRRKRAPLRWLPERRQREAEDLVEVLPGIDRDVQLAARHNGRVRIELGSDDEHAIDRPGRRVYANDSPGPAHRSLDQPPSTVDDDRPTERLAFRIHGCDDLVRCNLDDRDLRSRRSGVTEAEGGERVAERVQPRKGIEFAGAGVRRYRDRRRHPSGPVLEALELASVRTC